MKKPRPVAYQSPLGPHLEQIQSWRRARKTWREIAELIRQEHGINLTLQAVQSFFKSATSTKRGVPLGFEMNGIQETTEDPLEMIHNAIIQSERDWDEDECSAIIFGIVCGWHGALPEVVEKFGSSEEDLSRLTRLRPRFTQLCSIAGDD